MPLTLNQFEVLALIERDQQTKHTQRKIASALNVSLGVVNKTIAELLENELMIQKATSLFEVTSKGYEQLEPYRVKKLFFLRQVLAVV